MTIQTSTGSTKFYLVNGIEVVLSVKVELSSLCVMVECETPKSDWSRDRYEELEILYEKRHSTFDYVHT